MYSVDIDWWICIPLDITAGALSLTTLVFILQKGLEVHCLYSCSFSNDLLNTSSSTKLSLIPSYHVQATDSLYILQHSQYFPERSIRGTSWQTAESDSR